MTNSGHASGEAVIGVTVAMTILATVAVVSRLSTRLGIVQNAGFDDAFICLALLFSIATTTTMILQVKHGMGRHQDTLSAFDQMASLKPFWVSIWVYNLAISCTKFSLLFQYLRIFVQPRFRIACYSLIAVVFAYSCWTFFSAVFACTPVNYFWNPNLPGGHCLDRFSVWFANASVNIVTDIATGVLPLPMLKSLNLPSRQRNALMIVFALGGFTCVVSILRLQSLYVISTATDVSWNNPLAAIWSSVEINTGILCSCLPTLKACASRFFPRMFSTHHSHLASSSKHHPRNPSGNLGYMRSAHRTSLDAFGQSLGNGAQSHQKSMIKSGLDRDSDEIALSSIGSPCKLNEMDEGQIQVVTVVQQEIERRGRSSQDDGDSTKDLVRGYWHGR